MSSNKLLSSNNSQLDQVNLQRKDDKLSTEVDDETVILDMESGIYNGLDAVGTSIWRRLAQEICYADLCEDLVEEYDIDIETCRSDTLCFLKELYNNGLITIK